MSLKHCLLLELIKDIQQIQSQINFAISFIFFIFPNPISSVLVPLHSKQTAEHSLHVNQ